MNELRRSVIYPAALVLASVLALSGCLGEPDHSNKYDPARNKVAPAVVATSPETDGVNGAIAMAVTAQFNTYLDPLSVTTDSFLVYDSQKNRVPGRVSCDGLTVSFQPVVPLFNAHTYTAVLTGVIRGIAGIKMPSPYSWSFTTAAQHIPDMKTVPGGTFVMGTEQDYIIIKDARLVPDISNPDPDTGRLQFETFNDSKTLHDVTVSGFEMGTYEVTFDEFDEFCDSTGRRKPEDLWGRGTMPVINVTWFDAVEYCNWLSAVRGYDPCYGITGTVVECDFGKNGFRLPTEAEWEYAARSDGSGSCSPGAAFSGYVDLDTTHLDDFAWTAINSNCATHKVDDITISANPLGIKNMSGNVAEWCWDWYSPYTIDPATNPTGPSKPYETGGVKDNRKVARGGGYFAEIEFYMTSIRGVGSDISAPQAPGNIKVYKDGDLGFRVCRRPYPVE